MHKEKSGFEKSAGGETNKSMSEYLYVESFGLFNKICQLKFPFLVNNENEIMF